MDKYNWVQKRALPVDHSNWFNWLLIKRPFCLTNYTNNLVGLVTKTGLTGHKDNSGWLVN